MILRVGSDVRISASPETGLRNLGAREFEAWIRRILYCRGRFGRAKKDQMIYKRFLIASRFKSDFRCFASQSWFVDLLGPLKNPIRYRISFKTGGGRRVFWENFFQLG